MLFGARNFGFKLLNIQVLKFRALLCEEGRCASRGCRSHFDGCSIVILAFIKDINRDFHSAVYFSMTDFIIRLHPVF